MKKNKCSKKLIYWACIFIVTICHYACLPDSEDKTGKIQVQQRTNQSWAEIDQLIQETFRIDIQSIAVVFDYYPEGYYCDCQAVVKFNMRPGQNRALIHLDPVIRDKSIVSLLKLNGQSLDIADETDVKIVEFENSQQKGLEFQYNLDPGIEHTLEINYRLNLTNNYYLLATHVNDFFGKGNEELFPTINSPNELARHTLTFRVHSDLEFRCLGSGDIQKQGKNDQQEWLLDTEREIASYTLMFVLMPAQDTLIEQKTIDGVKVTIMAFVRGASIAEGFSILESWLPELRQNLGPFPMPRGLSIFLMSEGGGMEYFGGTISSLWALKHEVFHMYFACSTVAKTYRDSWLDEAINKWYEYSVSSSYEPIWDYFASNMVSGRSPIGLGFDIRAYDEGARIMQAVANNLGGREKMIAFLKYLQTNYMFKPFTTENFLQYLQEYADIDMEEKFRQWLYQGETVNKGFKANAYWERKHQTQIIPPPWILEKYSSKGGNK